MKVRIKIFPGTGLSDKSQEQEIYLNEGRLNELIAELQERLGVDLFDSLDERLMLLHNGRALGKCENVIFKDEDQLWLLPRISGG